MAKEKCHEHRFVNAAAVNREYTALLAVIWNTIMP
jgi:hypothetical protein